MQQMPLEVQNNELSNSILSLQPDAEVPPELPPPRMRCCWDTGHPPNPHIQNPFSHPPTHLILSAHMQWPILATRGQHKAAVQEERSWLLLWDCKYPHTYSLKVMCCWKLWHTHTNTLWSPHSLASLCPHSPQSPDYLISRTVRLCVHTGHRQVKYGSYSCVFSKRCWKLPVYSLAPLPALSPGVGSSTHLHC